ncbi:MAG: MucR family transcriptional regulator [Alphaproteobacteria bacterium]|nr:MucR family transcriptional regulator [Alphaproteobacteria bacterium]HJM60082.1 MucR family transcriptional regulator [Alphaproteobacteria bacterium]
MTSDNKSNVSFESVLGMTSNIVSSYVSHNALPADQIPELIKTVYTSLDGVQPSTSKTTEQSQKPVVSVRRSITPDYIICLEDGKKLKMLKRHLRTKYSMSPEDYRAKWNLPVDYPMVAPNYAKQRSEFAKKIGLGRKKASSRKRHAKS